MEKTNSDITLRIQPRDPEYYTGEIVVSKVNNSGSKLGIEKVAYTAGDIEVKLANSSVVYNGKDQKPEAKDIVVTDKKSGTVLDSKKVIKSISASSSDVKEAKMEMLIHIVTQPDLK